MLRIPLVVAATAAVLALTACTGSPSPSASPSAPASASASVAPSSAAPASSAASEPEPSTTLTEGSAEQRYLSFVQQFSPSLAQRDPSALLTLGRDVCSGFAAGKSATQVAEALGSDEAAPDLTADDGSVILGAAVATLCPKYKDALSG